MVTGRGLLDSVSGGGRDDAASNLEKLAMRSSTVDLRDAGIGGAFFVGGGGWFGVLPSNSFILCEMEDDVRRVGGGGFGLVPPSFMTSFSISFVI